MERLLHFSIQSKLPFITHMPTNSSNCQELNLPISIAEIELAIARLNPNKVPGLDKIQGSYLNHPALTPLLYRLFSLCFNSALIPSRLVFCTGVLLESGTITPIAQTQGVGYITIELLNNNLG